VIASRPSARIDAAFARARAEHRAALIPYVVTGDPDVETTVAVVEAIADAGADIVELGIPYGDPLADGPTIAAAAQRALDAGTTMDDSFAVAERLRGRVPIVFFTYYNPVYQYGVDRFAQRSGSAGVSGAIVPDVPLEESELLRAAFRHHGIALPLLVAPTTPRERAGRIAAASDGFVYVVSRLGVTGARKEPDVPWIEREVTALRKQTDKPLAVGFGISTPAHVRAVAAHADGVIIGSALIDSYAGSRGKAAAERAGAYVATLKESLRRAD
jgi:tryptophan synthase alpha chain